MRTNCGNGSLRRMYTVMSTTARLAIQSEHISYVPVCIVCYWRCFFPSIFRQMWLKVQENLEFSSFLSFSSFELIVKNCNILLNFLIFGIQLESHFTWFVQKNIQITVINWLFIKFIVISAMSAWFFEKCPIKTWIAINQFYLDWSEWRNGIFM